MEFHIKHWNGMFRDFVSTMSRGVFVSRHKDACEPTPELLELCHQANSRGKMQQSTESIETDWNSNMMWLKSWHDVDMLTWSPKAQVSQPECRDDTWDAMMCLGLDARFWYLFLHCSWVCTGCAHTFTRVPGITASASPGRPDELNWFGSMTRLGWAAHWLLKLAPSAPSPGCSSAPNSRTAGSFGCNVCVIRHLSALSWSSNAMQTAVCLYIIWFKLLHLLALHDRKRSDLPVLVDGIESSLGLWAFTPTIAGACSCWWSSGLGEDEANLAGATTVKVWDVRRRTWHAWWIKDNQRWSKGKAELEFQRPRWPRFREKSYFDPCLPS